MFLGFFLKICSLLNSSLILLYSITLLLISSKLGGVKLSIKEVPYSHLYPHAVFCFPLQHALMSVELIFTPFSL
jgi:hypothetical protein